MSLHRLEGRVTGLSIQDRMIGDTGAFVAAGSPTAVVVLLGAGMLTGLRNRDSAFPQVVNLREAS